MWEALFFVKIIIPKNIMYICLMYSKELLKGTLQTIILKLLTEQERMYGYEITQKVKELTSNQIQLTEGALYPTLHKLEAKGLLSTEIEMIGKRKRKYYRLTPAGQTETTHKLSEFQEFMSVMQHLLFPKTAKN